ncbi:fructosamine kinase family protein [Aureibaculum conchae]|uniref:fructosamine kinase family protein n=1 Tax=Aureibaculum sp. 2308TA14-22 TaxID=3108392 RepID=UPI0033957461
METFIAFLSKKLRESILKYRSISGGDISNAFLLSSEKQDYFLKINSNPNALDMFKAEQKGLTTIAKTNTIKTPKIIDCGKFEDNAYLLLENIPSKQPTDNDFEKLGHQLAELHLVTTTEFGFDSDNFIGSLPQSNHKNKNWVTFYTKERLMPQLKLAVKDKLLNAKEIPEEEEILEVIHNFCKKSTSTLLHGDLWSGNFLIDKYGEPYLIDPAVYYGHNEVDIAMSQLFGGFPPSFYKSYHSLIPKSPHCKDCIKLYQLYYLLVHLNLFGKSYYGSVKQIIKNYF